METSNQTAQNTANIVGAIREAFASINTQGGDRNYCYGDLRFLNHAGDINSNGGVNYHGIFADIYIYGNRKCKLVISLATVSRSWFKQQYAI